MNTEDTKDYMAPEDLAPDGRLGKPGVELTPQEERAKYRALGYRRRIVGEVFYPIHRKWFLSWVEYTAYNRRDEDLKEDIEGGLPNLHKRGIPRPGPIDNKELCHPENPVELRRDITEHKTHEWIHRDQWNMLFKWYGGGPDFPRKVAKRPGQLCEEIYIDQFPLMINLVEMSFDGQFDLGAAETTSFPREKKLRDIVNWLEETEEKSKYPQTHLWCKFKQIKQEYATTGNQKEDLQKTDDDERWVEIPDDKLDISLLQVNWELGNTFLVERQNADGSWPMNPKGDLQWSDLRVGTIIDAKDSHGTWYESFIREVGPEKIHCHFIGWAARWDEYVGSDRITKRGTKTKGPRRPKNKGNAGGLDYDPGPTTTYYKNVEGKPEKHGIVGFRNMGNTCYLNSTVQCLVQSPNFADYFLDGDFVHHINRDNALGKEGEVAEAWAELLYQMFSDQFTTIAPAMFKTLVGKVNPVFVGSQQHDSHEFLLFLLDSLHEDLNQIMVKPLTDQVESNGRPDEVVAAETWKQHLKRNRSIIVDSFQAQMRSRVECQECENMSVNFDPYMVLSVPLPTQKTTTFVYTFVGADTTTPPKIYGDEVYKSSTIGDLKQMVAERFGVPIDELFACDVWDSKVNKQYPDTQIIQQINRKSDDVFIYHAPKPEVPDEMPRSQKDKVRGPPFKTFPIICQISETTVIDDYYRTTKLQDKRIGVPLLVTFLASVVVTCNDARLRVFDLVFPFLTDEYLDVDDEQPYTLYARWGYNTVVKIDSSTDMLPINERNFQFICHFQDSKKYRTHLYDPETRMRSDGAPSLQSEDAGDDKPCTLDDCFDLLMQDEVLEGDEVVMCKNCQDFKPARKKIDIWTVPDLLIIHLKRFDFTEAYKERKNTMVDFPIVGLDLSEYAHGPHTDEDVIFDLYGVSNHRGTLSRGHYTAYTRNLSDGLWYRLDDDKVSPVNDPRNMVTNKAYVLYYHRRKPHKLRHRASFVVIPGAGKGALPHKEEQKSDPDPVPVGNGVPATGASAQPQSATAASQESAGSAQGADQSQSASQSVPKT